MFKTEYKDEHFKLVLSKEAMNVFFSSLFQAEPSTLDLCENYCSYLK